MILDMKRGRPSEAPRCGFGERLLKAREAAGLSQAQLAEKLDVLQRTVAYWERRPSALLPEQVTTIAKILNVPVEQLLYDELPRKAARGPVGKVRSSFEEVSKLPKREQTKIVEVVDALVTKAKTAQ